MIIAENTNYITAKETGKNCCVSITSRIRRCVAACSENGLFNAAEHRLSRSATGAMCMAFYSPDILKYQILRLRHGNMKKEMYSMVAPQIPEADVRIRKTCSDDLLWFLLTSLITAKNGDLFSYSNKASYLSRAVIARNGDRV